MEALAEFNWEALIAGVLSVFGIIGAAWLQTRGQSAEREADDRSKWVDLIATDNQRLRTEAEERAEELDELRSREEDLLALKRTVASLERHSSHQIEVNTELRNAFSELRHSVTKVESRLDAAEKQA